MRDKNVHSGHRERLRNRFLATGMLGFSEHEILELLLFYAIPRSDTNELAHALVDRFGSISAILNAAPSELSQVKGMGEAAASFIKFIDFITRSIGKITLEEISAEPNELIRLDLIKRSENISEDFFSLYFINSHSFVADTSIYYEKDYLSGKLNLKSLIEDALILDVPSVMIGICHKNKLPLPTNNDYLLIRQLCNVFGDFEITIDDAIVAGSESSFSLRSDGAFDFTKKP